MEKRLSDGVEHIRMQLYIPANFMLIDGYPTRS